MNEDNQEAQENHSRNILMGTVLWIVFAPIAVAIRGVRWSENYEFAQVILGQIPYPESHPLMQHIHTAFSLQTSVATALLSIVPSELIVNGYQNILFVMASTIPIYLMGTVFTGRSLWGHVAALLVLMEIHVGFFSTYPIEIWPVMGTNGATGLGFALLALYGIIAGRLRLAFIIIGLMPAIHIGQLPPIWAVGGVYVLNLWRTGARDQLMQVLKYWGVGLGLTGLFFLYYRAQTVLPPVEGAYYFPEISSDLIWSDYMRYFASHRAFPWGTGHIMMGCAVLFSSGIMLIEFKQKKKASAATWAGVYIYCIAALVWGIALIHLVMGPNIPYLLISWMPYRLMNHMGPLLMVLMLGVLVHHRMGIVATLVILLGVARPLLPYVVGDELVTRYLSGGVGIFLGLFGASMALLLGEMKEHGNLHRIFLGVTVLAWCGTLYVHQFGAVCALSGYLMIRFTQHRLSTIPLLRLTQFGCVSLCFLILIAQWNTREHLPRSDFEKQVSSYLAQEGEADAMIAVRYLQYEQQARLGHPVTTDIATVTWIPYTKSLRPGLYKLYRDLYGMNLAPSYGEVLPEYAWYEVWPAKERTEWIALSEEYGVDYVIASEFMEIDLPLVIEGDQEKLYRIPHQGDHPD